jgi:hypothetical protein
MGASGARRAARVTAQESLGGAGVEKEQGERYLDILAISYYVLGGLTALAACFPIIHFIIGLGMLGFSLVPAWAEGVEGAESFAFLPFTFVGVFFTVIAGLMILLGWAYAVCLIVAGRFLAARRRHTFCMVVAAIACAFVPFGTALGVFTILTITQPAVRELFQEG